MSEKTEKKVGELSKGVQDKGEELTKKLNDLLTEYGFILSTEMVYDKGGITAKPVLMVKND